MLTGNPIRLIRNAIRVGLQIEAPKGCQETQKHSQPHNPSGIHSVGDAGQYRHQNHISSYLCANP